MRLQDQIDIDACCATCFDISQDYALRPLWDSLTPRARPAPTGGAAHCPAPLGMAFDVAYVSFQRPRVAAFRMVRGPWLFRSLAGSWRFEALPGGRCRVRFVYHLRLHRGVAWLLEPLVAAFVCRQSHQRLRALRQLVQARAASALQGAQSKPANTPSRPFF
ncbi:MAG: SRPBCC family protein [Pseudomonadota bacterium]|nr:SRPBCC family protein [Pseudomonadota bacterium]